MYCVTLCTKVWANGKRSHSLCLSRNLHRRPHNSQPTSSNTRFTPLGAKKKLKSIILSIILFQRLVSNFKKKKTQANCYPIRDNLKLTILLPVLNCITLIIRSPRKSESSKWEMFTLCKVRHYGNTVN